MNEQIEQLEQNENEQLKREAERLKQKYLKWSEVFENFHVKYEINGRYMIVKKIIGIPHIDLIKILCNYILAEEYHNGQMRMCTVKEIAQVRITDKKISTNKASETRNVINNSNLKSSAVNSKKSREKGLLLRLFGD